MWYRLFFGKTANLKSPTGGVGSIAWYVGCRRCQGWLGSSGGGGCGATASAVGQLRSLFFDSGAAVVCLVTAGVGRDLARGAARWSSGVGHAQRWQPDGVAASLAAG